MKLVGKKNSDVIDLMMSRLGDRKAEKLRNGLVYELNSYIDQRELQATLPWFLNKLGLIQITAENAIVTPLPEDFLREEDDDQPSVFLDGIYRNSMKKVEYERLDFDAEGPPKYYAILGENFYVAPMTLEDIVIRFNYKAASSEVVYSQEDVTNVWLLNAHNVVTFGALIAVASFHIQAPDMAQQFRVEEKNALDALWRANEARQHTNMNFAEEE